MLKNLGANSAIGILLNRIWNSGHSGGVSVLGSGIIDNMFHRIRLQTATEPDFCDCLSIGARPRWIVGARMERRCSENALSASSLCPRTMRGIRAPDTWSWLASAALWTTGEARPVAVTIPFGNMRAIFGVRGSIPGLYWISCGLVEPSGAMWAFRISGCKESCGARALDSDPLIGNRRHPQGPECQTLRGPRPGIQHEDDQCRGCSVLCPLLCALQLLPSCCCEFKDFQVFNLHLRHCPHQAGQAGGGDIDPIWLRVFLAVVVAAEDSCGTQAQAQSQGQGAV